MNLHTASEAVSFAKGLEERSARFYEQVSQRYGRDQGVLLSFMKGNEGNVTQVERTYYGVITDAIEGCFSFDMNPNYHTFETRTAEEASYAVALGLAIEIEEKITAFYSEAAEQARCLMADLSRAFAIIARKRSNRVQTLKSLLSTEDRTEAR